MVIGVGRSSAAYVHCYLCVAISTSLLALASNTRWAPGLCALPRCWPSLAIANGATLRCGQQAHRGTPTPGPHDRAVIRQSHRVRMPKPEANRTARSRVNCSRNEENMTLAGSQSKGLGRLVSRHGAHLAVGVGSTRDQVLVGDLGSPSRLVAAALPRLVACRCRVREIESVRRGGRRHQRRRGGVGVCGDSSR